MPFCSNCGTMAHERDRYCAKCGTRQPVGTPAPSLSGRDDPMAGISPRMAAILCYIPMFGWVAAIIVLASRKFRANAVVRFHAFQGLYLFAAWLFVQWAVRPMFSGTMEGEHFRLDHVLHFVILGLWIFMIIKASHEEAYSLPLIGELAHRSAAER